MPTPKEPSSSPAASSPHAGGAFLIDDAPVSISDAEQVARHGRPVALAPRALERLKASNAALARALAGGAAIYGVNTGFGSLSRTRIADADLASVQRNLIRSHAAGVGEALPEETVRAMLLLLACSLARGCSGVRPVIVETLARMLSAGVTPVVPSIGSVGASGDLAPLAHAALVLIGEGSAMYLGALMPGGQAMQAAGIAPVELGPKEGLALINGSHLMAAQALLLMADVERLTDAALIAAAMSIDASRGTDTFLNAAAIAARGHVGPVRVAARLRNLLDGSQIIPSHRADDPRVQDPYSLRCTPQVVGAALDSIEFVRKKTEDELGAVTDNPLIFEQDGGVKVISAGNFHGMPIAVPLDLLPIALAPIAGISERRVFNMLAAADAEMHLRPHLSPVPGLQSGLMITQYTAAACVNELATLCMPASVINVPTCAGMEDYNSFGPRAAAKARRAVDLCTAVVAIELICAAEALEYHRPLRSGHGVELAHAAIRQVVPKLTCDRSPAPDIQAVAGLIRAGRLG